MHIRLRYVVHVTWLVQSKLTYGRININCKNIYVTDIHSCTCIARTCSTTANMTYCTCIYTYLYTCMYIYIHMSAQDIMCKTIYTSSGFGGFLLSRKHYQLQCCPSQVQACSGRRRRATGLLGHLHLKLPQSFLASLGLHASHTRHPHE